MNSHPYATIADSSLQFTVADFLTRYAEPVQEYRKRHTAMIEALTQFAAIRLEFYRKACDAVASFVSDYQADYDQKLQVWENVHSRQWVRRHFYLVFGAGFTAVGSRYATERSQAKNAWVEEQLKFLYGDYPASVEQQRKIWYDQWLKRAGEWEELYSRHPVDFKNQPAGSFRAIDEVTKLERLSSELTRDFFAGASESRWRRFVEYYTHLEQLLKREKIKGSDCLLIKSPHVDLPPLNELWPEIDKPYDLAELRKDL